MTWRKTPPTLRRLLAWIGRISSRKSLAFPSSPVFSTNLPTIRSSPVLEERRQRIADGLANADKIKAELARTEAMQRDVLDKANAQANKLIEEARAAAARVQEQETQKAIAQAEQIITKAREAAAIERARMLTDLRREVGTLVVNTTSQVIGKVLTPEDQRRLNEETRRQLAA